MSMPKELKEGSRFFNQTMVDREHDQRVNMERTQAGRGHSCPRAGGFGGLTQPGKRLLSRISLCAGYCAFLCFQRLRC